MKSKYFVILLFLCACMLLPMGCDFFTGGAGADVDMSEYYTKAQVDALLASSGGGSGSVFTRWGNATAPAGSELIYSGYAVCGRYDQASNYSPIVFDPSPTGVTTTVSENGALIYGMVTETSSSGIDTAIPTNCPIKAAVCWSNKPTVIVWGTHTPPPGWSVLYRGYAMGGNYTHPGGSSELILVDSDNFDSTGVRPSAVTLVYQTEIETTFPGYGCTINDQVKGVLCVKN